MAHFHHRVLDPLDHIVDDGVAAADDEHPFMRHQCPVDREEQIDRQVAVEWGGEQHALVIEDMQRGIHILRIHRISLFHQLLKICSAQLAQMIFAGHERLQIILGTIFMIQPLFPGTAIEHRLREDAAQHDA